MNREISKAVTLRKTADETIAQVLPVIEIFSHTAYLHLTSAGDFGYQSGSPPGGVVVYLLCQSVCGFEEGEFGVIILCYGRLG